MNRFYPDLRLRYRIAFETYEGCSSRNVATLKTGATLSADDLADETRALRRLNAARQAMLHALLHYD